MEALTVRGRTQESADSHELKHSPKEEGLTNLGEMDGIRHGYSLAFVDTTKLDPGEMVHSLSLKIRPGPISKLGSMMASMSAP
eukprot:728180-Pelagomonas_calceolata.AAC.1